MIGPVPHGGWAWRLPFMLSVAVATALSLSAIERPASQARGGPVATRVSGVDAACAEQVCAGLVDLRRRLVRLTRALERGDLAAFEAEQRAFDQPLDGWHDWPMLRLGGRIALADGAEFYEWPDTSAAGIGIAGLDARQDGEALSEALTRASATAHDLSRVVARLCAD